MIFLFILLRATHKFKFFYVSYRAYGRESGKTRRLLPGQLVLKSRSESTIFAVTPDSDSETSPSYYPSTSRSLSPSMSNSAGDPNQNQQQAPQSTSLPNNVHNTFFQNPLTYPQVPVQPNYSGTAPNPQPQPVFNPAPMQTATGMYDPAQFFNIMAQLQQQYLRNTQFVRTSKIDIYLFKQS